jgi:hypothetical protein
MEGGGPEARWAGKGAPEPKGTVDAAGVAVWHKSSMVAGRAESLVGRTERWGLFGNVGTETVNSVKSMCGGK